MRKQHGFTLVEALVAIAVTAIALAAAVLLFRNSMTSNASVVQAADMSDNMRASLNFVVQDLIQTGTGIPTGGIAIPNSANAAGCNTSAPVNRPPAALANTFQGPNLSQPGCNVILPAIEPGPGLGPTVTSADGTTSQPSDVVTILYADNTVALNSTPINGAACPNGAIDPAGASVTFDSACVTLGSAGIPINTGDLIMFNNANGNCLQTVTSVAGQTLFFAAGDAFNLNGRGPNVTGGTILQLQNQTAGAPNGTYPTTSATRIWMITYYLDNTVDPVHPRLMREVNFNTPQTVADTVEGLQFTYNLVDGTNPSPTNQPNVPAGDNENEIRSVNINLGARSSAILTSSGKYVRGNLATQVALRSMAYFNNYQ
jgi:prepilin-type N-terminal cleavage/methylation domain-containing protein